MAQKQALIPKLRFPEFNTQWESTKLGEFAKFSKGKNVSKNDVVDDGKNECIRYGELYTDYGETISEIKSRTNLEVNVSVVSKENDVIIPASGETEIDIATASCVLKSGVILGGDLNIIRTNNNGVFLAYYLNNKKKIDIARLSQGSSVVHLYSSQLATLKIQLPSLQEQQKIASFLSVVDTKIQQLERKKDLLKQYKKGVMQQLFSQDLRFKQDDGSNYPDWEEKKLKEVIKDIADGGTPPTSNKKNFEGNINWVVIEDIKDEIYSTSQSLSDEGFKKSSSKLWPIGSIILSTGATIGRVGINYISTATKQGICGIIVKENILNIFLKYWFIFNHQLLNKYAQGSSIKEIRPSTIQKFKIMLPSLEEQTKIANFLSAIDAKIALVNTQIEHTKTFKKGLLQQMFV